MPAAPAPGTGRPAPTSAAPLSGAGDTLAAAASGRPSAAPANPQLSGLSSIARNRLQREVAARRASAVQLSAVHADPARIYHERFGVGGRARPVRLPWLMNLIFEDRWLLAENNPTVALQNQLRRRMKIDIRDPDPDTANFPNGAYTLPKGRVYIENSPVGFYGRSSARRSPVQLGIPVSLRHDRQPRVPHLLQRPDRDQGQERNGRVLASGLRFQDQLLGRKHQVLASRHGGRTLHPDHVRLARIQQRHPAIAQSALRPHVAVGFQL